MKFLRSRPSPRRRTPSTPADSARGFTLVEVLISSIVMTILMCGLFSMVLQSRRLTEGSIIQNSAVTVLQGYIEQMKNMDFNSVLLSPPDAATFAAMNPAPSVPTVLDESTPDALTVSWGAPPSSVPKVTDPNPVNAIDNIKQIAMKNPVKDDSDKLNLTIWLWVQDLTGSATDVTQSKAITMIYTYQFLDGGRTSYFRGTIRTIRSVVPSY